MEFEWHGPKEAVVYTGWLIKSTDNPDGPGSLRNLLNTSVMKKKQILALLLIMLWPSPSTP
jgi:hypothetical protein